MASLLRPLLALALCATPAVAAQTTYVDVNANGANNGSSWTNAYVDLQDALAATATGEIWVAAGRYRPAPVGQPTIAFQLKDGVGLYGGFVGTETSRSQRDVVLHEVVLDGDLASDDTYGSGPNWWQYGWYGQLDNSGRIVDGSSVGASAILDGFTIAAGYGPNAPSNDCGPGLFIQNGSPVIRNCTFRYNSYGYGASIYIDGGAPVFEGCTIKDAYTFGRSASGVYVGSGSVSFTDCVFANHYTVTIYGQNDGSAFYASAGVSSSFLRCSFIDNQIGNYFAMGDPSGSYGAGIYSIGDIDVESCEFSGGFGNGGSAIATYGSMQVSNSKFYDNFARPYETGFGTSDGDAGAAILVLPNYSAPRTLTVDSCTFVDNYCDKGAGIFASGPEDVLVTNSVLYFNDGPTAQPGEDQVPRLKRQFVGAVSLQNCCVQELWVRFVGEDPFEADRYPKSFDQDPRFVDWQNGNLNFFADSPCLNSGNINLVPPTLTVDLNGDPRVQGTSVDLGCYESSLTATPSLTITSMVTEVQSGIIVFNAQPGETVYFAYSFAGLGPGNVIAQLGGLQLDILAPAALMLRKTADASGRAIANVMVPLTAPIGDIFMQAAIARGSGGSASVLTNTVSQVIHLNP